ncbi:putative beta-glucosidase E [Escovopsis weberi]|uniref:beta-glucosidase n=1 Tax=Escovopsis weberi TaxID=150374 RepID=A0A0M8MPM6_ESCWE|nr:putative beta-glucosidase E [Escovopsis weberi]
MPMPPVDPATEGLLKKNPGSRHGSPRVESGSADSDLESDLELEELTDPLEEHDSLREARSRSKPPLHAGISRPPLRWRAPLLAWIIPRSIHKCRRCLVALLVVGVIALLLAAGGAFGFRRLTRGPAKGRSPPWYPSPKGGTVERWAASYQKAAALVSRMTLPEKVNITTGTGWMMGLAVGNTGPAIHAGFPALALQDGPLGIRFADHATAFPAGITVGATWNRRLMYERGRAHALEARGKGINVLLGPSIGPLGRMPAGGRNWEGFGPDPYLQGIAGAETIRGIQDQGVMATVKHFVANEQEHFRQAWAWGLPHAISSNIDDRTMHEIYAWPFCDAVMAGVASVMCSYNMVNSSYACGNSKLLNGILKDELGFQGFVMSDWLAQRSGVASALAGLDMSMPGDGLIWQDGNPLWGPHLSRAVLNGSLPMERLDDMVLRIVASWYQLGQDDPSRFPNSTGPNFSSWTDDRMGVTAPGSSSPQEEVEVNKFVDVQADHASLARRIAAEGTVLLKNVGVLPLSTSGQMADRSSGDPASHQSVVSIGIFGEDAGPGEGPNFCSDRGCNQGTLGSGWGSGAVEFPYLVAPIDALLARFDEDAVLVNPFVSNDKPSEAALAGQDICMVFVNSDSGEGYLTWQGVRGDRNDLKAQKNGDDLVVHVARHCGGGSGTTIVVVHAVGPVVMEPWIDLPSVQAVIAANLPGQESGNALADIIFGDVNPSARLPYTIGKSLADYGKGGQVLYYPNGVVPQQDFNEGLYIDYRHFDKHNIEPRFEFGFGLSYGKFDYSHMKIMEKAARSPLPAERPVPASEPPNLHSLIPNPEEVLFPSGIRRLKKYIYPYIDSVKEIKQGKYPFPDNYSIKQPLSGAGGGQAVPQLYLSYPESQTVDFPVRVLRGFDKIHLDKGESKAVQFNLTRRDLSYWDAGKQNWVMPSGQFTFAVGESSRDLRLRGTW